MPYDHVHRGSFCPVWVGLVVLLAMLVLTIMPRGGLMGTWASHRQGGFSSAVLDPYRET
jgi:hypothetical protein